MANTIQIKRSSTAAAVPTAGQLAVGELAVNLVDKKLYSKDAGGSVVVLSEPNTVLPTPVGTIINVAMNTAPTGYLKANGAAVSRTTYAALFAAIGTTFGAGDGSTTFALPDLRGEFIRGWDDGRGVDSGRGIGTAQSDELESHTHTGTAAVRYNNATGASGSGFTIRNLNAGGSQTETMTATINSTGGTETRPRNVALLACIKF